MERKLLILGLIIGLLFIAGCNSPSSPKTYQAQNDSFTIRVTGYELLTDGRKHPIVEFSGNYMTVMSNGTSQSRSVDGNTPREYYIGDASIVSVSFQKGSKDGMLTVEILKNNKVIKTENTTANYGIVSITTR